MPLTQEYVKELFEYEDGSLFWRKTGSGRVHKKAGCPHRNRYIVLTIKGKQYPEHRVIFLYHHGYLPEHEIDHINRVRDDNRIENLREVSVQCNQRNTGNRSTNKSGVKGVLAVNMGRSWRSGIRVDNVQRWLGTYPDKRNAVLARLAAEQCLNWQGCDVSSPAYQYALKHKLVHKSCK